ncbi:MAG: Ca-activated chloride channel family protein, partial [Rhodothermales bacterium]
RGLSMHEPKLESTPHRFASYFGNLSEVLVADLHYRISGDAEYEMYPRELPHLFRTNPLTIYGKAPAGADVVDVQIVGRNSAGKREELILQKKLSESAAGGPALIQGWAAQKIYHLIAERSLNKAPGITEEIDRLSKEHGIEVPY